MHFKIIVPMYNVESWISTTIASIKSQSYTDYQCIVIDDCSTDNSIQKAKEAIGDDKRFTVLSFNHKRYALGNWIIGIDNSEPDDEDVVVQLDGDDWFANSHVLEKVKTAYQETNCLITYGNHIGYPGGESYIPIYKYPKEIIDKKEIRKHRFLLSHLRTFKYKVWKNIKYEDFLDEDGSVYKMTCDLAIMLPMLEMVGDRHHFISDILYVHNSMNPLNDNKVNQKLQQQIEEKIRNKKPYERIF